MRLCLKDLLRVRRRDRESLVRLLAGARLSISGGDGGGPSRPNVSHTTWADRHETKRDTAPLQVRHAL